MVTQTYLEQDAIQERNRELLKNEYTESDQYNAKHPNALSDGDSKGKGTNTGGHGSFKPNHALGKHVMNYSNFDTTNGGGKLDIEGRNGIGGRERLETLNTYNSANPYDPSKIVTTGNPGQYRTN